MKKRLISVLVMVLLVLSSFSLLAENSDDTPTCGFWCKLFNRDNLAGQSTCSGFWNCLLGRENMEGGTTTEKEVIILE